MSIQEKTYRTMGSAGAAGIVTGVIVLTAGIVTGVIMIVHGARLLSVRKHLVL